MFYRETIQNRHDQTNIRIGRQIAPDFGLLLVSLLFPAARQAVAVDKTAARPAYLSAPPTRPLLAACNRPQGDGPARYVDSARGNDASGDGSQATPWRTINHALRLLAPGDTLYLRGGTFHENVYCAVVGSEQAPITIRSYPGEVATIDGGMAEFETQAATAWRPVDGARAAAKLATDTQVADAPGAGHAGEYISTRAYKNIRDVIGSFGDSNIGLQTYWYAMDLRATNELWIKDEKIMVKPVYCGPGIWYDKKSGYIHARLAHTNIRLPKDTGLKFINYRGETDPRKLPLVIATFASTPLLVDQAMHVRFQDLVIRGGGYVTVRLQFGVDIEFDNCRIYCGTYGIWSKNTGPLKMTNCGVYGTMQPWAFRSDLALYSYDGRVYPPFVGGITAHPERGGPDSTFPPRPVRHITRLTTHAVFVPQGFMESEVFAHPQNHDWEISNCEFTDGHDGVYLSGRNIRFHHNWVTNMNDDGIYLSSPSPYVTDKLYVYQNLISTVATGFAMHGRGGPGGDIYVYRNIVDMRGPIRYVRPSPERPQGFISNGGMVFFRHGYGLHMERMSLYQNTCLLPVANAYGPFAGGMIDYLQPDTARRVFNNIYVYYSSYYFDQTATTYPLLRLHTASADAQIDGNLHWHMTCRDTVPADFLSRVRNDALSVANKANYAAGWAANSLVADPKFVRLSRDRNVDNDYRPQPGSPVIGHGVVLPADWDDPLRPADGSRPDMGALPHGAAQLKVGIHGRIPAGSVAGLGLFQEP